MSKTYIIRNRTLCTKIQSEKGAEGKITWQNGKRSQKIKSYLWLKPPTEDEPYAYIYTPISNWLKFFNKKLTSKLIFGVYDLITWTTFSNSEPQFLPLFKNNICTIIFPMYISVFMNEPEIVVPNAKWNLILLFCFIYMSPFAANHWGQFPHPRQKLSIISRVKKI